MQAGLELYVAQASLLAMLLLQPPECWGYGYNHYTWLENGFKGKLTQKELKYESNLSSSN